MTTSRIDASDDLKVITMSADNGHVEVAMEYTHNLGNFENIKIRTGAGRPLADGENPTDAMRRVWIMVAGALVEFMAEAKADLN